MAIRHRGPRTTWRASLRRVLGPRRAATGSGPSGRVPVSPAPGSTAHVLAGLGDGELCQVWRSSHHHLVAAPSIGEAVACVRLRQLVLNELDSRHPHEVAAWVALGAAGRSPESFLPGPAGRGDPDV